MGVTYSQLSTETDRTCMLVGAWVSTLTWGIIAFQLLGYLQAWKRDPVLLRLGVLFLFAVETTTTIMICIGVYHQLLEVAPDSLEYYTIPLIYASSGYLNNVTLMGVDWFFISRYYRLSGNKWIRWFLIPIAGSKYVSTQLRAILFSTIIFASTLAAGACFFRSASLGIRAADEAMKRPTEVAKILKRVAMSMRVAYVLEILAVTSTVAALLTELIRQLKQELLTANELIKRLILFNVGSGAFTAALSVATFIYCLRNVSANTLVFNSALARSYLMAMLFNLAVRNFQSMTRKELPISNITVSTGVSSFAQTHESVKFPPQKHSEHTLDDDLELSPVEVKV